jgi:hypothetical protein
MKIVVEEKVMGLKKITKRIVNFESNCCWINFYGDKFIANTNHSSLWFYKDKIIKVIKNRRVKKWFKQKPEDFYIRERKLK